MSETTAIFSAGLSPVTAGFGARAGFSGQSENIVRIAREVHGTNHEYVGADRKTTSRLEFQPSAVLGGGGVVFVKGFLYVAFSPKRLHETTNET